MIEALDFRHMKNDEKALALSAQGILNRKEKRIFADIDIYKEYLPQNPTPVSLWDLLGKYASDFDGCTVYDLNCRDIGINLAATISAAYDLLGVPRTLLSRVNACGIATKADLAEIKGSFAERQRAVFDACFPRLAKDGLVHQVVKEKNFHITLRDFSIARRFACIYTGESDEDRAFRREVLQRLQTNIPVYGWNDDEIAFIADISSCGDYAVPTDWSCNHSLFTENGLKLKPPPLKTPVSSGKHYVAIVVSDGDNVQWLERDFSTSSAFGQRQKSSMDYKMTWTFAPTLPTLCPGAASRIYGTVKQDEFLCGVSGIGYANCLTYPREHLDAFTEMTAAAMERCDLHAVCLLDNITMTENAAFVRDRLHSYSRFDTIKGGIWELDPDRYGSGKGKIFWSDNKPFISVRETMWHPSGDGKNITNEWLDGFVNRINASPIAPESEAGYTVLNIHPWTVRQEHVDYVVKCLADHVETVSVDELISLIQKNIIYKEQQNG